VLFFKVLSARYSVTIAIVNSSSSNW
jgi:hypothetical protein